MPSVLFQLLTRRCFRMDRAKTSRYRHVAGGPPLHEGVRRGRRARPARLHYLLDLADSAFGLEAPPVGLLPLYWSHDYENGFRYRILSDHAIEIMSKPRTGKLPEPFLQELPSSALVLQQLVYDSAKFEDAYYFSGLFGINHLDARMKMRVIRQFHKDWPIYYQGEPPDDVVELLEAVAPPPFPQGLPNEPCCNADCPNHRSERADSIMVFQVAPEKETDAELFDEFLGGQLIFVVCRQCFSVSAHGQCT